MTRWILAMAAMVLVGCSSGAGTTDRRDNAGLSLPSVRSFSDLPVLPNNRSNASIARDFMDLSFQLEKGRELPVFTRFEGPITLRLIGRPDAATSRETALLLQRLRREAGIDITRVSAASQANITVEVVSQSALRAVVPHAACIVEPGLSSWSEYRGARRSGRTDWTALTTRSEVAIFLPDGISRQEARDCLHEEIAQALGPLNDLYRLSDSVFNDDNFRTVLTGFDMVILKATYDPALRSGMTRAQVAARLPQVLDRVNPRGRGSAVAPPMPTPQDWTRTMTMALDKRVSKSRQRAAAASALATARASGWTDNRLGFALFTAGRLSMSSDPEAGLSALREAARVYADQSDSDIQQAHVALQLAGYNLATGQPSEVLRLIDDHAPAAARAGNAALLSTLLMMKAEALIALGRDDEASRVRTESLQWAGYGYATKAEILERQADIAAISPRVRLAGPT